MSLVLSTNRNTGEECHFHRSVLQFSSLDKLSLVPLAKSSWYVHDKDRVGKVLVGSIKGFIQLVPDVGATDIGANTGTLKLSIAVCTEQVFLGSATTNSSWQ